MSVTRILAELAEVGITQEKIAEALADNPAVNAAVVQKTYEARDYWKSIAPVRTGAYRDSITASFERGKHGELTGRVESKLDPVARLLEYGSKNNPEFACRQKTVEAFKGHGSDIQA